MLGAGCSLPGVAPTKLLLEFDGPTARKTIPNCQNYRVFVLASTDAKNTGGRVQYLHAVASIENTSNLRIILQASNFFDQCSNEALPQTDESCIVTSI